MTEQDEGGSYQVLGLVGRGGMAEVYLVRHRRLNLLRALKVLHLSGSDLGERLAREGRFQARVEHRNVLPVLEEVRFLGRPALVLPYVEGPSLDRFLSRGRPTPAQGVGLFRGVVEGVAAIHAEGLVHRDLKPGNVLLDPASGEVVPRVSDFGLARALYGEARLTRTGIGMGTPVYAAPEQMQDAARADARADVWALGCLLVDVLLGLAPDDAPPHVRLGQLTEPWAGLAHHLLSLDPRSRPAHAGVVLELIPESPGDATLPAGPCRQLAPAVLPVAVLGSAVERETQLRAGGTLAPALPAGSTVMLPHEPRDRLPAERDAFVGRARDLESLQEAIAGARLVTVLGPGGVGKTRLVLRWARTHRSDWRGVWFVDLCEARSVDEIVAAMAVALEVRLDPADPVRQLGHALAGRGPCVLWLDNFEQVAPHAEATIGRWLDRAPDARFVVTSRSVLGIPGERPFLLAPLEPPDAEALFLRRASAARSGFSPSDDDRADIRTLVDLLDRLPLAIELAAARIRTLSPRQIHERMQQRFTLLTAPGGRRDRHATLRATLDWSWELLGASDRQALAWLSVFEGGFTLEAAEAVLRLPEGTEIWAAVQALADQSLVVVSGRDPAGGDGRRLDLLMSVREYAAGKLAAETGVAEQRHGLYFARLGQQLRGAPEEEEDLAHLDEIGNTVVACRRAIARADGAVASGTLEAAAAMLSWRGPLSQVASLAAEVLAIPGLAQGDRGRALAVAGDTAWWTGRPDARAHLEAALVLARAQGDDRLALWTLAGLGMVCTASDLPARAERMLADALALARKLGDPRGEAIALVHLGILRDRQGRATEAAELLDAALGLARRAGDRRMETRVLANQAILLTAGARYDEARSLLEGALALARQVGDRQTEGVCLANLGTLRWMHGPPEEAAVLLEAALVVVREVGNRAVEGLVCGDLGKTRLVLGRPDAALPLLEAALSIHRELGNRRAEGEAWVHLGEAWQRLGRPDPALACSASARAILRAEPDPRMAHGLRLLAALHVRFGDPNGAADLLDEGLARLREAGTSVGGSGRDRATEFGLASAARGELALQAGAPEQARALLAEARALPLGPASPARASLDRLEAALDRQAG